jgi:hypothetical protein
MVVIGEKRRLVEKWLYSETIYCPEMEILANIYVA